MTDRIPDIPQRPEKNKLTVKPALITGLVIIASIFIVRLVAVDFYVVKSSSMNDLLLEGDHIVVSRQAYFIGFPYVKSFEESGIVDYLRLKYRRPKRDDLIVFEFFDKKNERKKMIKRIVAIPGDSVHITSNTVKIMSDDYMKLFRFDNSLNKLAFADKFVVPAEYDYKSKIHKGLLRGVTKDSLIADDYYFVIGDNIDDSYDSRKFGLIPMKHIIGKPLFIYWSMLRDGASKEIRLNRVGKFLLE